MNDFCFTYLMETAWGEGKERDGRRVVRWFFFLLRVCLLVDWLKKPNEYDTFLQHTLTNVQFNFIGLKRCLKAAIEAHT